MDMNVGNVERGARVGLGLVALSMMFWGPKSKLGIFGLFWVITGILGWCPMYAALGTGTRRTWWDKTKARLGMDGSTWMRMCR